jgi:hypothetical protein
MGGHRRLTPPNRAPRPHSGSLSSTFCFPQRLRFKVAIAVCHPLLCFSLYCTKVLYALCSVVSGEGIGTKANRDASSATEKQIMAQSYMNIEWPRQTLPPIVFCQRLASFARPQRCVTTPALPRGCYSAKSM